MRPINVTHIDHQQQQHRRRRSSSELSISTLASLLEVPSSPSVASSTISMFHSVLLISVLFVCIYNNCVHGLPPGLLHPSETASHVDTMNDSEIAASEISASLVQRPSECPRLDPRLHCFCQDRNLRIYLICNHVTDLGLLHSSLQKHTHFYPLWLRINGSDIPMLMQRTFGGIKVEGLQINFSNVSHISDNAFTDMEHLKSLALQANALETVPVLAVRRLLGLEMLSLAGNHITSIPNAAFVGMPSLHYVSLAENAISVIHKGSFGEQLKHLALSSNNISTLNGSVRNLPQLEWLLLTGNHLVSLENELVNLPSLATLHLEDNRLRYLRNAFNHLLNLQTLHVANNKLEALDSMIFRGLTRLLTLVLSNNAIHNISKDAFSDLEMLTTLNLSNNRLVSCQGFLLPMRNLKRLDLSNNLLEKFRIKHVVVTPLPLPLLNLSANTNNKLNELSHVNTLATSVSSPDKRPVQYLPHLKTLFLSGNRLTSMDFELRHLASLAHLHLDKNNLTSLSDQFVGLPHLQVLNLSHNNIHTIVTTTFDPLFDLVDLDLSHNHLQRIQAGTFHQLVNLQQLNVSDNKIDKVEDGLFNPMNSLMELDLSNNAIVHIHPMAFVHLHSLRVLNLDRNQLKTTAHYLLPLFKLETLILADNSLDSVNGADYSPLISLRHLDLSRNQIIDVGTHFQVNMKF